MTTETINFLSLLAELGIDFTPPLGFVPCPACDNDVFRYQYALRSPCGEMELRYRVDSFARLEAERKSAAANVEMQSSVNLDQLHGANFMAILMNLSAGRFTEPTVFSLETTALLYSADWNALSFLRLGDHNFAPDFNAAFVLCIHKAGIADVHVVGLYHEANDDSDRFDKNNLPAVVKSNIAPTLRFT